MRSIKGFSSCERVDRVGDRIEISAQLGEKAEILMYK